MMADQPSLRCLVISCSAVPLVDAVFLLESSLTFAKLVLVAAAAFTDAVAENLLHVELPVADVESPVAVPTENFAIDVLNSLTQPV